MKVTKVTTETFELNENNIRDFFEEHCEITKWDWVNDIKWIVQEMDFEPDKMEGTRKIDIDIEYTPKEDEMMWKLSDEYNEPDNYEEEEEYY